MINYYAKIDVIGQEDQDVISSVVFDKQANNISMGVNLSSTHISLGEKVFILSSDTVTASLLDDGSVYAPSSGYDGFMSTDYAGNGSLTMTVSTNSPLYQATIYFDKFSNQYPQQITYEGKTITNNSADVLLEFESASTEYTIVFSNWTQANLPFMVSSFSAYLQLVFGRNSLFNFNFTRREASDNETPSYGVIANDGQLIVHDTNGLLRKLAKQKILKPDQRVKIYLNDKEIAVFDTEKWTYQNSEQTCTIDLKDRILELQKYEVSMPLSKEKTAEEIYQFLTEQAVANGWKGSNIVISDEDVARLKTIIVENPYIEKCSLWEAWNKFSHLASTRVYSDNGKIRTAYYGI